MKNKLKKVIISFMFAFMLICGIGGFVTLNVEAVGNVSYMDVFETELLTVTPNFGSTRRGMGFTSSYSGANAKLVNMVSGDFESEFSLYNESDEEYLKELAISFADSAERGFSLIFENRQTEISVSVAIGGNRYGLSYNNGVLEEKTISDNAKGIYTRLPIKDSYKVTYSKSSGAVMVCAGDNDPVLVWCVGSPLNDGCESKMALFDNEYAVRFTLNKVVSKNAKSGIILYSINGQSLANSLLNNTAGPNIYVEEDSNAVSGEQYYIPQPIASDLLDGRIEDVYVSVKNSDGVVLEKTRYQKGLSFVAENDITYIIEYSAADSQGKTSMLTKTIKGMQNAEVGKIVLNTDLSSTSYGIGSNVFIPGAYAVSDVFGSGGINYKVSLNIMLDGAGYREYKYVSAIVGSEFVFDRAGTYTFVFNCKGENYSISESRIFIVDNDSPTMRLSAPVYSEYEVGEKVVLPEMQMQVGEQTITADKIIRFPDGEKYIVSKDVVFENEGWYELEYCSVINGGYYGKKVSFKVTKDALTFTNGLNHYTYEKDGNEYISVSFDSSEQSVVKNGAIDLRNYGEAESFLEIEFKPSKDGVNDFTNLYVTLTDANDPLIYVQIKISCLAEGTNSDGSYIYKVYAHAKTNISDFVGVNNFGTANETVSSSVWGTRTLIDPTLTGASIKLAYDVETNIVYINKTMSDAPTLPIVDLDNLKYFDKSWTGFTTGEVNAKVNVSNIASKSANLSIRKFGQDAANVNGAITLVDNYDGYPLAEVGKPYKIFDAVAMTSQGSKLPIDVKVVLENNKTISVATDGKTFIPFAEGLYCIVYSTKGLDGKTIERIVTIEAVKALPNAGVCYDLPATVYVGSVLDLSDYVVTGANGKYSIATFIEQNGKRTQVGKTYMPQSEGKYAIIFEITDYNNRASETRVEFECLATDKPIFLDPKFDLTFVVCGNEYVLPEIKAYDSGMGEIASSISVIAGENIVELTGNKFTPNYTATQDITVRYTAIGQTGIAMVEYSIKAVCAKVNDKYIANELFVSNDDVVVGYTASGLTLTANKDGKTRYINAVSDAFSLSFTLNSSAFEKLNLYLTDSEDENNVLQIGYEKQGDGLIVRINGTERIYRVSGKFGTDSIVDVSLTNGKLTNNAGEFLHDVVLNARKNEFSGFKGRSVYVDLEFVGVTGPASVTVIYLNNQSFKNQVDANGLIRDMFEPQIVLCSDYGGINELGESILIPKAVAYDVLSGKAECTVSCYKGLADYLSTTDGNTLNGVSANRDYWLTAETYGLYTVEYTASDANGRAASFTYVLRINDNVVPTIEPVSAIANTAKIGSTLDIPTVKVSDNVTASENIRVYVNLTDVSGKIIRIHIGDTVKFDKTGKYVITYLAYDEANNVAIESYEIIVK